MITLFVVLAVVAVVLALVLWTDTFSPDYIDPSHGIPAILDSPWTGYSICLFQNNIAFDYSTTIGGLNECNFTGYSRVTPGSATPGATSGKTTPIAISAAVFTAGALGSSQTAFGYFILDSGGNLIGGGTFGSPGPYTFAVSGDSLTLTITEDCTVVP